MKKRSAGQLVSSYGALRLASRFEEAIEQLNSIWELDPIDFQILRPSKSLAISNRLRRSVSAVSFSGKSTATGVMTKNAMEVTKTAGDFAAKTAAATEKIGAARKAAGAAAKVGVEIVKKNKLAAAAAGAATMATTLGLGFSLQREPRRFNDSCYKLKLGNLPS